LNQGRDDLARAELDGLERSPLSLHDRTQATVLAAELLARRGDAAAAQATLLDATRWIHALAQRTRSDVLGYVIERQDRELRRSGLGLVLAHDAPTETNADAWSWLASTAVDAGEPPSGTSAQDNDRFDRAVANELLPGEDTRTAEAIAQRELLARLAKPERDVAAGKSAANAVPLASLQATLGADTAFAAYLDGDQRGALLWITRDAAQLIPAAAPDIVRTDAIALQRVLSQPGTSSADIQAAARQLSSDLLAGVPDVQAPRRLFVLDDELARGIPWSTLPWTGAGAPLVESTAVSLIRLARKNSDAHAADVRPGIQVVVSAQQRSANAALPTLANAQAEAGQIRAAIGDYGLSVDEDAAATRDAVVRAFDRPGGWVHVAAHGFAQPQRIGYSGLWLEPAAPETTPAFLSWIDVLDRGVRSDLVVLDACQSADGGTALNGNLSFADAVSRAGARRVVAALWPVSDAASALWVPAFYHALVEDSGHDAATALQAAQLRLRASRAFTHPFFWAGLQAIARLDLPEPALTTAALARPTPH
jgi:CHAT domain-containing protein